MQHFMNLKNATPFIFFTGKGGVGKTSLASATAIKLADTGKKVLLICTDPASNLRDVLETDVTEKVTNVEGVPNLQVVNIDPEKSADAYRNRVISPLEDILPPKDIDRIREELSGACTTEIAAFDEFARYIAGDGESKPYDIIIFDTAPTGHTLRLLELPAAWSDFIEDNPDGASCIGPSSALKTNQARYKTVVKKLQDEKTTTIYLVTRPDKTALKEADRSGRELLDMGLSNQQLLINGSYKPVDNSDPFAAKLAFLMKQSINEMPDRLKQLPHYHFPLRPWNLLGIEKLRQVFEPLDEDEIKDAAKSILSEHTEAVLPNINDLVNDLSENKDHGLIMTMGKGGVGKTVIAAAIAMKLAQKGYPVHLTTTDPAAHLIDYLDDVSIPQNLELNRIDPHAEKQAYIERILRQKGKNKTEEELRLLKEDLESPCTEEVAVFQAFSKAIQQAKRKFVVIDTAPTGHTLLLLDTTGSYHKEVMRNSSLDTNKLKTPLLYLQNADFTKLLLITLPETTPISEAAKLQDDLRRSGIEPYTWIANQSMSATEITDPVLKMRAAAEVPLLSHVKNNLAKTLYSIPFITETPLLEHLIESHKDEIPN